MKKVTFILIALISFSISAQKKKNGTVYIDHPAIDLVESFSKAWIEGDVDKAASFLHDDFKIFNATSENKDSKGSNKDAMVANMTWWVNNSDYLRMETSKGAYPDAIEYKKGDQLWVQTWDHLYAVNKQTGVKFDSPIHRLYLVSNDSKKILNIQEYNNANSFRRINLSWPGLDRKNGTIYINHENINTVRKTLYSFVNGDYEKSYSYWHENAVINDINLSEPISFEDAKKNNDQFLMNFNLDAIEQVGYPDYLEYDLNESKDVLSWWKFRITRKSDGKKFNMPIHYIHGFNNDGKIINATVYYNGSLLE